MTLLELIFWLSIGLVVYAYLGYPLLLGAFALLKARTVCKAEITPSVTFIITAYNEEGRITHKLDNTLKLMYPKDLLEIIVASDCSSDQTDELAKLYESRGVKLVRAPQRKGKEAAQKLAVPAWGHSDHLGRFHDTAGNRDCEHREKLCRSHRRLCQ